MYIAPFERPHHNRHTHGFWHVAPAIATSILIGGVLGGLFAWHNIPDTRDSAASASAEAVGEQLREQYPDLDIDHVTATAAEGVYGAHMNGRLLYVVGTGPMVINGPMLNIHTNENHTEKALHAYRAERMETLSDEGSIIFRDKSVGDAEIPRITVFFDPDCPYCQRYHEDLLPLAAQGRLEIRYFMFAPNGETSDSADRLRTIWCADDPQRKLTEAAKGEDIRPTSRSQCAAPVAEHRDLAADMGITGTPYTIFDNGQAIVGAEGASAIVHLAAEASGIEGDAALDGW